MVTFLVFITIITVVSLAVTYPAFGLNLLTVSITAGLVYLIYLMAIYAIGYSFKVGVEDTLVAGLSIIAFTLLVKYALRLRKYLLRKTTSLTPK